MTFSTETMAEQDFLEDTDAATDADSEKFGTFTDAGDYIPRIIIKDDLAGASLEKAVDDTIVVFDSGDLMTGTVVRIDRDEVLLDIGYKSEGVIPSHELSIRTDADPSEIVSLGDQIEALVLQKEDLDGRLIMSKKRAQYERAWKQIDDLKEQDGIVSGPVIEVVKGGLIVDIGLRGFLPASLIELRRVRDLEPYLGQVMEAKILELDKNRNNVVLSRRAWLEESQKEERKLFMEEVQTGQRRTGKVSSIVSFGAFVDLGGMDGLVHLSELSWKHVDHPNSVVQIGDEVEVEVLGIDRERERISLSLKATQEDPWQVFANTHRVDELVYGRVTKLVQFGAFVQVGEGIEGLVHISEMSAHHVEQPEQVVAPGEELWVKIIGFDLQRRRISFSIKQAAEGGVVADEYQAAFGEHAYDDSGKFIGDTDYKEGAASEGESEAERAWREYYEEHGEEAYQKALAQYATQTEQGESAGGAPVPTAVAPAAVAAAASAAAAAAETGAAVADASTAGAGAADASAAEAGAADAGAAEATAADASAAEATAADAGAAEDSAVEDSAVETAGAVTDS